MAEEQGSGERTEEATSQRREDFRKEGQVAQTKELSTALVLLTSALIFGFVSKLAFEQVYILFHQAYGPILWESIREGDFSRAFQFAGKQFVVLSFPILTFFMVIGVAANVLQTGFMFKEDALQLRLDALNPIQGFQKLFSMRGGIDAARAILKMLLILGTCYMLIRSETILAPKLIQTSVEQLMVHLGGVSFRLFMGIGILMAVFAVIDYGVTWWELERRMMMTKQEVREEHRSREGDPQIKARIRKIQRDTAQKRMMDNVKKADVIITNPTHIAIALRYDANLPAPQLIAKGAGEVAERIKQKARELNIPIVENKPLARAMFKTMKLGQVIPRELYNAVAEVLAYVYRLRRKRKGAI